MEELKIYISGICKGNPGKGSYAYTAYDELNVSWLSGNGVVEETTNNKMELSAAIKAAESIKEIGLIPKNIYIYSDSAYLVNCFNDDWIGKWKTNGWKNNKGENVVNSEYWAKLDDLVNVHKIKFDRLKRSNSYIRNVNKTANDKLQSLL